MGRTNWDEIKVDVEKNEKEVLEFLHSLNIFERGGITSPSKDVWFKFYHYIQIVDYPCQDKFYHYIGDARRYQGEKIKVISFEELKFKLKW